MPSPTQPSGPQSDSVGVLIGMVSELREEGREEARATREVLNRVERELASLHAARMPERIAESERRLHELELAGARSGAWFALAGALGTGALSVAVYVISRSLHP